MKCKVLTIIIISSLLVGCNLKNSPPKFITFDLCSNSSISVIQEILHMKDFPVITVINENGYRGCSYDAANIGLSVILHKENVINGVIISSLENEYNGFLGTYTPTSREVLDKNINFGKKSFFYDTGTIGSLIVLNEQVLVEETLIAANFTTKERKEALMDIYKKLGKQTQRY